MRCSYLTDLHELTMPPAWDLFALEAAPGGGFAVSTIAEIVQNIRDTDVRDAKVEESDVFCAISLAAEIWVVRPGVQRGGDPSRVWGGKTLKSPPDKIQSTGPGAADASQVDLQ